MAAEWLSWVADWPIAAALRRSLYLYPFVNAAHLLGIALLIGAIVPADLLLLGVLRRPPAAAVAGLLTASAGIGLALAVATGLLLFIVKPGDYAVNPAFLTKVGLVLLGTLNAIALRLTGAWRATLAGAPVPARVKAGVAFSLSCWLLALVAGRWIAFLE
ncbi:DUF2214 domain-containing protein [Propylenella binzhouense]|uniref:DUF2214 domain-containing protein n=1 Tax=Propylenella binzhouense TaxID=2555902 RepID=A0A964WUF4_9HYPH|nr:DUF2214 domain-containing protein [Propylenella binzhouense]MYZ49011.1 DUF2214 domain-containing protein [Propylenella binzhouense]